MAHQKIHRLRVVRRLFWVAVSLVAILLAPHSRAAELPKGAIARFAVPGVEDAAGIYLVRFSPDGKILATRDQDQVIRLWDTASGKLKTVLKGHQNRIKDLDFSPNGDRLVSAAWEEGAWLWNTATGERLAQISSISSSASAVRFAANGKTLRIASRHRLIQYDLERKKESVLYLGDMIPLAISPDGRLLASVRQTEAKAIDFCEVSGGAAIFSLKGLSAGPVAVAFSPGNRYVAACARRERAIKVWDTKKPQQLHFNLQGHEEPIQSLAFSPEGRFLASASWDQTIRIWELETGCEITAIAGHTEHVCAVAFSPDGRLLASGASGPSDRSALLWDFHEAVAPRAGQAERLAEPRFSALWDRLAGEDAAAAYQAAGSLAAAAVDSVPRLQSKLKPALRLNNADRIKTLIADLDSDRYAVRENATAELRKLRPTADGWLQKALAEVPSPEVRLRIHLILNAKVPLSDLAADERRRILRIIFLLEMTADPPAKNLLRDISTNFANGEIARRAGAALQRLTAVHP